VASLSDDAQVRPLEWSTGFLDNTSGMTLVGLAFLLGLLMLKRHIKKHMQSEEKPMTMQEIAEINLT
jgi:hypothetical protein